MSPCLLVNHLPVEIWQQIFTLACVDGGYTGTSLALVSQFFHHASHPVRFRSLSLSSLRQIEQFLDYVQKHSRSTRDLAPRVNHLLLAFPHVPSDDSNSHDDDLGTGGPDLWYNVRQLRDQEKARWDERFMIVVPRLLDFAAPHLASLTVVQSDGFKIPPIRHCLPRLRELTILTGIAAMLNDDSRSRAVSDTFASSPAQGTMASIPHYPDVLDLSLFITATNATEPTPTIIPDPHNAPATSSLGHPAHARARFPALERLHLVCGRHRDWTLRDPLAHLPTLAPALTHLRISNATYTHGQDGCVPDFLCAALGRGLGLGVLRPTPEPGPSKPARAVPVRVRMDLPHRDAARARTPLAGRPLDPDPALLIHASLQREREQGNECEEGLGEPAMRCLRRVAVHSVPPPPAGRCASPYKDYDGLVQAVRAMGAAWEGAEGADVRVTLIEGERMKHEVWVQMVRAQWLDRIGGGRGCWDDDDDLTLG